MANFDMTLFIDRPPQEVFDYITNPDNDKMWQETVISSEWITPEPAGVGSKKQVELRFLGRNMTGTAEYTAWDPPGMYQFMSDDSPFALVGTTRFEPKDDGTQLTLEATIDTSGLLKLALGFVARRAEKQDITNFNNLKRILEAE